MSTRRLWVLVNGLPPEESATWRRERPGWTLQDELLAQLLERTDYWGGLAFQRLHGLATGKWPKERDLPELRRTIKHPDRPQRETAAPEKRAVERDPEVIKRFFHKTS